MDYERVIVHRANAKVDQYPVEVLTPFISQGYRNVEVDVTVTGRRAFKFCHPSQSGIAPMGYRFDTQMFARLAEILELNMFMVDIKYLDYEHPPTELLLNIHDAFGDRVIFSAAVPQLLTEVHELGGQTAQFLREDISPNLPFEPDYLIYDYTQIDKVRNKMSRAILYCGSIRQSEQCIAAGAAYVLVDSYVLHDINR